jgi:branched-subunit amino acid transport protein AzlD
MTSPTASQLLGSCPCTTCSWSSHSDRRVAGKPNACEVHLHALLIKLSCIERNYERQLPFPTMMNLTVVVLASSELVERRPGASTRFWAEPVAKVTLISRQRSGSLSLFGDCVLYMTLFFMVKFGEKCPPLARTVDVTRCIDQTRRDGALMESFA